ncbi:MAG: hypothetical protein CVV06_08640 [Gammaproteobacteria bacterium HGW-Gammaproteobacteria-10]|nr:MAG: hypothetical protein CVV06_08640 [Gammaproteobacteria bacterium HGW-Gammaproteobacteria-10]
MQARALLNLKSISLPLLLVMAILGNGNCYASLDSWRTHSFTFTAYPNLPLEIDFTSGLEKYAFLPLWSISDSQWITHNTQTQTLVQDQSIPIIYEPFETYFSLGNELNGNFQVTLTPTFLSNSHHSLEFEIAEGNSFLIHSMDGTALFRAEHGLDYYVFLNGSIRGDQSYNLQLTQVPLPASIWFLGIGLAGLLSYKRPYKQIRV